ncbi:VOC family protein [Rhodobacteraceae bacterium 2CG4]|uniref:VOC family protein n=1 Tax=Halovulum marinum TaxID=2662447 RepID=A0A6L5Z4A1_9RHOB|nr:VOC family protein [Halovulum marinum]MSU91378.1 VOC family protein [Halovulum marinum]
MPVEFNHTLVWASDPAGSATFLSQILGLPEPRRWGPFHIVETANGVNVDYARRSGAVHGQHYAYLVSEADFDAIQDRIRARGLPFWADPEHKLAGEINRHDGGRGLYFDDPDGHNLEVITRPYGSGGWDP